MKKERSLSDPDLGPKDELKKSLEEFQLKKRLHSQNSSDDVFSPLSSPRGPSSPLSSPRGPSNDTEAKAAASQPSTAATWTVVDVGPSPPKQEASKVVIERAKPPVPTKPKPPPPPKTKPKSPGPDRSKELSAPKNSVTATASNEKPSKAPPPKRVSDYEEIRTDGKTSKEELPKIELKSDAAQSKAMPSTTPSGGVKSMMSVFEGGKKEIPAYSKPDMSQKKPKSFFSSENKAPSVTEKTETEDDIVEEPPAIPGRNYTEEDVSSLSPNFKPPPPGNSSPQASPKQNRFNASGTCTSPGTTSKGYVENPYEVVEPRKAKSPVAAATPPHQRSIESRKDLPPVPPSPFRDRGPAPPVRDVSLSSSSVASSSAANVDADYATVTEAVRRPLVSNESLYSEVEDTTSIPEVEAYFTTDVVRNLPTKSGEGVKRAPPPKPLPYKLKNTVDDDSQLQTPSDPNPVKKPPPKPAPYQPKTTQGIVPNQAAQSNEGRLQSPVSPTSPRVPVVMPGSPRLASAKIVSDSVPSSTSSSPNLDRPPRFKPPPPPRVSSIADATKEEVTQPNEGNGLNSYSPVNGVLDRFDKNEIPTRDSDTAPSSKPSLPRKPQFGSKVNQNVEENGPPSFKPPPPPKSAPLVPRAYGTKSGSVSPDRERAGSQNGTDSFGIIDPPSLEWIDGKSERSPSKSSVDSLDLKIVPPPPVHFKALDNNNEPQTLNLAFDMQTVNPPPGWQEGIQDTNIKRASLNSMKFNTGVKKEYWKSSGNVDYDLPIVPPPPPSDPPPTLPLSGPLDYELDLVPSPLSDGPGD